MELLDHIQISDLAVSLFNESNSEFVSPERLNDDENTTEEHSDVGGQRTVTLPVRFPMRGEKSIGGEGRSVIQSLEPRQFTRRGSSGRRERRRGVSARLRLRRLGAWHPDHAPNRVRRGLGSQTIYRFGGRDANRARKTRARRQHQKLSAGCPRLRQTHHYPPPAPSYQRRSRLAGYPRNFGR